MARRPADVPPRRTEARPGRPSSGSTPPAAGRRRLSAACVASDRCAPTWGSSGRVLAPGGELIAGREQPRVELGPVVRSAGTTKEITGLSAQPATGQEPEAGASSTQLAAVAAAMSSSGADQMLAGSDPVWPPQSSAGRRWRSTRRWSAARRARPRPQPGWPGHAALAASLAKLGDGRGHAGVLLLVGTIDPCHGDPLSPTASPELGVLPQTAADRHECAGIQPPQRCDRDSPRYVLRPVPRPAPPWRRRQTCRTARESGAERRWPGAGRPLRRSRPRRRAPRRPVRHLGDASSGRGRRLIIADVEHEIVQSDRPQPRRQAGQAGPALTDDEERFDRGSTRFAMVCVRPVPAGRRSHVAAGGRSRHGGSLVGVGIEHQELRRTTRTGWRMRGHRLARERGHDVVARQFGPQRDQVAGQGQQFGANVPSTARCAIENPSMTCAGANSASARRRPDTAARRPDRAGRRTRSAARAVRPRRSAERVDLGILGHLDDEVGLGWIAATTVAGRAAPVPSAGGENGSAQLAMPTASMHASHARPPVPAPCRGWHVPTAAPNCEGARGKSLVTGTGSPSSRRLRASGSAAARSRVPTLRSRKFSSGSRPPRVASSSAHPPRPRRSARPVRGSGGRCGGVVDRGHRRSRRGFLRSSVAIRTPSGGRRGRCPARARRQVSPVRLPGRRYLIRVPAR